MWCKRSTSHQLCCQRSLEALYEIHFAKLNKALEKTGRPSDSLTVSRVFSIWDFCDFSDVEPLVFIYIVYVTSMWRSRRRCRRSRAPDTSFPVSISRSGQSNLPSRRGRWDGTSLVWEDKALIWSSIAIQGMVKYELKSPPRHPIPQFV